MMKPKLIVIAGPNGSGKTTFTSQVLRHDWAEGCLFINPDEIANNKFGDWNSSEAVVKAALLAQDMREECLRKKSSLLFETVCSVPEKIDFMHRAQKCGFFIRFFFIGTDDPEINAARVARRVMSGGHDVPISKIISRYYRSMANCALGLAVADRGYVYDNSVDDQDFKKLFRTKNGQIFKRYIDFDRHEWAPMIRDSLCESMLKR